VILIVVLLLVLRLSVLVSEAYAMVVGERAADDELVELCSQGAARESTLMRQACMQATVDRASPVIARALTRGAYSFAREVCTLLEMPFRTLTIAGVVGFLGFLPWLGTLRSVMGMGIRAGSEDDPSPGEHTIMILQNGDRSDGITERQLVHRRVKWLPSDGFDHDSLSEDDEIHLA